jgi:acetyltransferase-like isoleucine patch superfamily enzyme
MSSVTGAVRHGVFVILASLLNLVVVPRLRARLLSFFGATVGRNVRVSSIRLINLSSGFRNLHLEDDVFIGPDCLLDLEGEIVLERGVVLGPRVVVLTHQDSGSAHGSPMCEFFPTSVRAVRIGAHSWIGASSTVLPGVSVGALAAFGAMSLIRGDFEGSAVFVGAPARKVRDLSSP